MKRLSISIEEFASNRMESPRLRHYDSHSICFFFFIQPLLHSFSQSQMMLGRGYNRRKIFVIKDGFPRIWFQDCLIRVVVRESVFGRQEKTIQSPVKSFT